MYYYTIAANIDDVLEVTLCHEKNHVIYNKLRLEQKLDSI